MEILQTYDLTGCAHSAVALAGCDPKTVRRHVERRDRGFAGHRARPAERLIDPFVDKVESPSQATSAHRSKCGISALCSTSDLSLG
jgi:hypothetical protein